MPIKYSMRIHIPRFNLMLTVFVASISAAATSYVVKSGDTLSSIARDKISKNIYGKDGSLKKIIALNTQLKNVNLILPGQEISIGESEIINRSAASETDVKKPIEQNVPDTATENNNLFRRGALMSLTPYFSVIALTSKDNATQSESTVASKYSAGITASYIQNWSERFQSAINLKIGKVEFEKPTSSIRSLSDSDKLITGFGIETSHTLTENMNLKLSADYSKELFIRAATTQSDTVDAVNVPSLGAKLSYDLANLDPFLMGVSGLYKAKMPTKPDGYEIKSGNELGASFYLKQFANKLDDSRFETELGLSQRTQNTNVSSQHETNIMLTLKYYFSVGRRQGGKP